MGRNTLMWIGVITLLPELFANFAAHGVARRAFDTSDTSDTSPAPELDTHFFNPREFTDRKHGQVDDKPYGGGPGMVMQAQPIEAALAAARDACRAARPQVMTPITLVVPTPQGVPLTQPLIQSLAAESALLFLCGRYEGIDERVLDEAKKAPQAGGQFRVLEVSLGDFVLTGGELGVQVILDAVSRWLPGTLGNADSAGADSFVDGLLEAAQYTRPDRLADERGVPEVLLSGDHQRIARYRRKEALARTLERRPELLLQAPLSPLDRKLLAELFAAKRRADPQV